MANRDVTLAVQPTTAAPTNKFANFRSVVGTTATLYVLETRVNHAKSMDLLDKACLMPFERQEILLLLMNDEVLKNALKGKWFYIAGKGLEEDGIYTINDKGDLVEIKGKISTEMKVSAWKGPHPLSLNVYSDDLAADYGRRFILNASVEPDYTAPVVVGKPKLSLSEPVDALVRGIENATKTLRRSSTPEDFEAKVKELQEKTEALVRMLRTT